MTDRHIEILALGPVLRDEATRRGKGVNESYLAVHRVLSRAFKEDLNVPRDALRTHLSKRLQETLQLCA